MTCRYVPLLALIFTFFSCKNKDSYDPPANALFQELSPEQTGIVFSNDLSEDPTFNVFNYRNYYNGGGVAIGDINNDGLSDIYFTSNLGKNKLFLNKGNWKFEDITASAGVAGTKAWSTGVAMVDINADGLLDIYVCNSGNIEGDNKENELFINKGNNVFKEEAAAYGLADNGLATHAAFFDYDLDGDLDCYLLNNSFRPIASFGYNRNIRNVRDPKGGHKLFRNDNGKFVDVSEAANIYGSEIGFGLGVSVADLNGDKWPDIYVSNDFFEKDYLYINQRNGTFKESIEDMTGHISLSSMGSDIGDINNDGNYEIFTSEMLPEPDKKLKTVTRFDDYDIFNAKIKGDFFYQYIQNALHLNNGDSTFSEISLYSDVAATDWSWGGLFFDFDNDGWKDLFISNGIYKDITNQDFIDYLGNNENKEKVITTGKFDHKEFLDAVSSSAVPNYAYVNNHNLTFTNKAVDFGLAKPSFSNGSAYGDLDNDGDLDLVVNNVNMPCFVYKNTATEQFKNSYVRIKLKGNGKNPFGIGAEVKVYSNGVAQTQFMMMSRGFQSSVDPLLVFGLDKASSIDSVEVLWPGFTKEVIKVVKPNSTIVVDQSNARPYELQKDFSEPLFRDFSSSIKGRSNHVENYFVDFDKERLIPQMYSSEGPATEVADLNGDGYEDIIVTGAKGDSLKLFLQNPSGSFVRSFGLPFNEPNAADGTGLSLFDADGDKDIDIFLVYGGNEDKPGSSALVPRLYLNDGKANFTESFLPLNKFATNASVVKHADIDADGDQDLFIGGRVVPGSYGTIPSSYLLLNNGTGQFTDQTNTYNKALANIGMVTDAEFIDVNNDKTSDLVLVGEWMPVTIFINKGNRFEDQKIIPDSYGLWNGISAGDVNNDGLTDLVLCNLGLNTKIKGNANKPVRLFVNDFDNNGQVETVLTYYKSDSISYPHHLRSEMVAQMPILKKKFLKYSDYAGVPVEKVFTEDELKNATVYKATEMRTSLAINKGNGNFSLSALPAPAQFTKMYAALVNDFDGDGKNDILLGGNFFEVKPEMGRYDASYSTMLKGDGKGGFTFIPNKTSGIYIKGEIRDIKPLMDASSSRLVIARNNEPLLVFKKN